jgi:hypothetical protein
MKIVKAAPAKPTNGGASVLIMRSLSIKLLIIAAIYVATRCFCLARDLVSEEAIFLMPGRFLFEGAGYYFNWGLIYPHADPFHKPPLTSLLLGAGSLLTPDGIVGGRLVPFLVGFFVCVLPLLVTRSIVPSMLLLASPFFYGASGHMQTDSTVGLLGSALICWALGRVEDNFDRCSKRLLIAGLVVLWVGKLELAVIASVGLAVYVAFQSSKIRRGVLPSLVVGTLTGIGLFVVGSWLLGLASGFPFAQSVGYVVNTVHRITTGTITQHAADAAARQSDQLWLWKAAKAFLVPQLFVLFLAPAAVILAANRRLLARNRPHIYLALLGILPAVLYMSVGHPSDSFPRYFLTAFPPLSLLLGFCLVECPKRWRIIISTALLALAAVLLVPATWANMQSPDSVTVGYGESGARRAAELVSSLTHPGDLVLGPDNSLYYIPDRRWLVLTSFEPYPASHGQALSLAPQLRAAILPRIGRSPILIKIGGLLTERGAKSFTIGSFEILAFPPN